MLMFLALRLVACPEKIVVVRMKKNRNVTDEDIFVHLFKNLVQFNEQLLSTNKDMYICI